jgi:hypothetical protein
MVTDLILVTVCMMCGCNMYVIPRSVSRKDLGYTKRVAGAGLGPGKGGKGWPGRAGFPHRVRYALGSALGVGESAWGRQPRSWTPGPGPPPSRTVTARGPGLRTGHGGGCCSAPGRPSFSFTSGTTVMGHGPARAGSGQRTEPAVAD